MANGKLSRSQHLAALVTESVLKGRLVWNQYAAMVVEHYWQNVDVQDRRIDFAAATTADNFERATRTNTQVIRRMLSGERPLDIDLSESLVAALPPLQRESVQATLLEREGLLLARLPAAPTDATASVGETCALMRATADAVQKIAPMIADGSGIGPEDAPLAGAAIEGLNKVVGAALTLGAHIGHATRSTYTGRATARKAH